MENLLTIDASAASRAGMARAVNSDNFYVNGRYIHDYEMDSIQVTLESSGDEYLFAVCDGMEEEGEDRNSSISTVRELKKLQEKFKASSKDIDIKLDQLKECAGELSNLVHSMSLGNGEEGAKKTSFSGLLLTNNKAGAISIGNSRTYILRNDLLKQLTSDMKKAERLLKMGIITSDQAELLTGSGDDSRKDPRKSEVTGVRPGDVFLLCTNGLTDLVDEDTIYEILSLGEGASVTAAKLVKEAVRNGGDDSVSALVVRVLKVDGELQEIVQPTRRRIDSDSIQLRARPKTAAKKNMAIRRYTSTAISILIIAALVFTVYRLWVNSRDDNDLEGLGMDYSTAWTGEQETTVAGTTEGEGDGDPENGLEPGLQDPDGETGQEAQDKSYTVQRGDNLYKISKQFYGTETKYDLIMQANDIQDPNKIQIGQVLIIPASE